MTTLQTRLESIRRLVERATDGPWVRTYHSVTTKGNDDVLAYPGNNENNADFMAASRESIPFLLEIAGILSVALETCRPDASSELRYTYNEAVKRCEELALTQLSG